MTSTPDRPSETTASQLSDHLQHDHPYEADQAAPAVAVPGWQLVPKEPTFEMIKEMWSANEADNRVLMERTWIAALAAAPSPPASGDVCRHCDGNGCVPGDPEADPIEECQWCKGTGVAPDALAAARLAGWEEAMEAGAKVAEIERMRGENQ